MHKQSGPEAKTSNYELDICDTDHIPKQDMPNYQNSKIYKIVCDETDAIYVGSTTKKSLSTRMSHHRNDYKRWGEGKMNYLTSFELVKYPSAKIILIKSFPCDSKCELAAKERKHIEKNVCGNTRLPLTTCEEKRIRDKLYKEGRKDIV